LVTEKFRSFVSKLHFGVRPKSEIFENKNTETQVALRGNFSGPVSATDPAKRRGKACSLHWKKNFLVGGCRFFVSDVISGGVSGHLGPPHLALGSNR